MKTKTTRMMQKCILALLVCLLVGALAACGKTPSTENPTDPSSATWTYSYEWKDGKCTATRVNEEGVQETETVNGTLTVEVPATKTADGKGYYTAKFKKSDFNQNYDLGKQAVTIPAGSDFDYGKAGLNAFLFGTTASKYYYAQFQIGATTQSGWVGVVHNADEEFSADGTYFFDVVSYKAGRNYEHGFGSVIDGENLFKNTEPADSFEGATRKGLTGADFANDGMTLTTIRCNDLIYLFINDKRVATYLIDAELATADTIPGLYFENNSTFYSGTLSNIDVVVGQAETEAKVAELLAGNNMFIYSNSQNWNKNEGLHTDATFTKDSFTYKYDSSLDLSNIDPDMEGYTHDRRFMTGVTDRVFLAGNYYYQYEITGDMKGIVDSGKLWGLFFNWVNSAQRSGIYYSHEAMLCIKEDNGLQYVHFDAGKGTNGDGTSGWTGGVTFGGSNSLKSNAAWQAAYKDGLIVRISRTSYEVGVKASYVMSVTAKSNPSLVLLSQEIVVDNPDKEALYGGYDWILFGTQSFDCTVSNVTFGRIEKDETGTDGPISGETKVDVNGTFQITANGTQHFAFDGVTAGKNYYVSYKLSAPTTPGYVGIAHWADDKNYFYDVVSYYGAENYYHAFSSVVNGNGEVYNEPASYFEGTTYTGLTGADFGKDGMTVTAVRSGDRIYTFINGVRIATYLIEEELAALDMIPVLYFYDASGSHYDGTVSDFKIITGETETATKVAELTTGSSFNYVNTPGWDASKNHADATFTDNGFTYAYDANVSSSDRRFSTGVNDRVFMAGDYYYQYEISGEMAYSQGTGVWGLFYNWINTKATTASGNYKHEANFCMKLNDSSKLQRLVFDKGSGVNGDGSAGWGSNTTAYGGRNDLENDAAWQAAFKAGLIVRIERTVVNATTDSYVITVTAKSDPTLKLVSTAIEVTDDTFGGYNWILFGTQSVECSVSNAEFGHK